MAAEIQVHDCKEGLTHVFSCKLLDDAVPPVALEPSGTATLVMSLMSLDDTDSNGLPTIINSRSDVNVLASLAAGGIFTFVFTPADMVMLNEARTVERHLMQLTWTYSNGTRTGGADFLFLVRNRERT